MAVPYRSLGSCLGLGLESSAGTAVSRTKWCHLNGSSLTQTPRNRATRGRLAHTSAAFVETRFVADEQVGGTVTVPGSYSALGMLLRAALGTVSGAGPFTFAAAAALPSLTIEQIVGTSGNSEVFAGCKVNSMTMNATPGSEVTFAFDIIAQSKTAASSAGSPSLTSAVPIEHFARGRPPVHPSGPLRRVWRGPGAGKRHLRNHGPAGTLAPRPPRRACATSSPRPASRST